MHPVSSKLTEIISTHAQTLQHFNEEEAARRPAPGKWSKKEELGHLIDSAHTNLRRFIVSQYEQEPHIVYAQEECVRINNYNAQDMVQLTRLWLLLNQQIVQVLDNMNDGASQRKCNTGKLDAPELHTLQWLAEDYVKHLLHHLHHILDMERVDY
jgi:hypothetical protein